MEKVQTVEILQDKTIFIQIASYKDPELLPTIRDCLKQAKRPENLRFCIAWQHSPEETFNEYNDDKRFKILDIPYQETQGACWARNQIQQHYNNETYTLQLDSHHRFVHHWDQQLIQMIEGLKQQGYPKPLITGYIPSFDPENEPLARVQVPWKMNFDRFIPEGAVFFLPAQMEQNERTQPLRARFYSAHFAFADGIFCKEVPHDPDYYFHGEEISIAVRAFTHGYDLFHSHKVIAWHEYTRKGRTKQWDDDKEWHIKNKNSHLRNRKLFGMDDEVQDIDFGIYGFGKVRSLEDYERYSGLSFKKRAVQKYTLENKPPPNPQYSSVEEYENSFTKVFKHCIDLQFSQVPSDDYDFWAVSFHDSSGKEIFREDAKEEEIKRCKQDKDGYCKIWRTFLTDIRPDHWTVWPHSKSKGWEQRHLGKL